MKKIFTSLAAVAGFASTAAVISCGAEAPKKKPNEAHGDGGSQIVHETPVQNGGSQTVHETPVQELKDKYSIDHDGLYVIKEDYKGVLLDNHEISKATEVTTGITEIVRPDGAFSLDSSCQMGDGDSIYMIYDNDDEDGLKQSNFTDTVFFEDTSISWSLGDDPIKHYNIDVLGNLSIKERWATRTLVKFVENETSTGGNLSDYFGSQNNHIDSMDFQEAIKSIVKAYSDTPIILTAILDYYGLSHTPNAEGDYDTVKAGASMAFTPLVTPKSFITYKRVDSHAVKMTFHVAGNHHAVTAAHITIKEGEHYNGYGSFSIGAKSEWDSYTRHDEAKYVALKSMYWKPDNA